MQVSYEKILNLNPLANIQIPYSPNNFDGNNGKGFLGIETYVPLDQAAIMALNSQYPAFASSKYYNKNYGYVIITISDPSNPPTRVVNSRVNNAIDLSTNQRTGIQVNDIILKVNNVPVDLNLNPEYVTFESYNNRFIPIIFEILRPSTAQIMKFKVISDIYPFEYEHVSITPQIELVTDLNTPNLLCNESGFGLNMSIAGGTLIYSVGNSWYPVLDTSGNRIISSITLYSNVFDWSYTNHTVFSFNNIYVYDDSSPFLSIGGTPSPNILALAYQNFQTNNGYLILFLGTVGNTGFTTYKPTISSASSLQS